MEGQRKTRTSSGESPLLKHSRSVAVSPLRATSATSSCNTVSASIRDNHAGSGEIEGCIGTRSSGMNWP